MTLLACLGSSHAFADVTIAFVGDQSTRAGARDVLSLIANEGVDLLVSLGDLGYSRGPSVWIANTEAALGEDFPVLAVVGNHEDVGWPEYKRWLEERVAMTEDLACEGDIGVKARCTFRGITILQSAPGVHEVPGVPSRDDYAGYLDGELASDPNPWRVCTWHKQMAEMQIGGKGDATGWDVYEACRRGGGIIATGHEHSYSRTHLMSDFPNKTVAHTSDHLEIGPGRTFAFVSGLGGKAVRPQLRGGDWWAAAYSATQGATYGALFCRFAERRAECWFKDIAGAVPDRFTLESRNVPEEVDGPPAAGVTEGMIEATVASSDPGSVAQGGGLAPVRTDAPAETSTEPASGDTAPTVVSRPDPEAEVDDAESGAIAAEPAAVEAPASGGGGGVGWLVSLVGLLGVLCRRRPSADAHGPRGATSS